MKKNIYLLLILQLVFLCSQIAWADKSPYKKGSVPPSTITVSNVFLRDTTAMAPYVGTNTTAENGGADNEEVVTPFDAYQNPRPDVRPPIVEIITTPFSIGMPTFHLPNMGFSDNNVPAQAAEQTDILAANCTMPALNEVRAYPNPVTDYLTVSFADNQAYTLSLINAAGQLLITTNTNNNGNNSTTIAVSHLPKGVYLLLVDNGQSLVVKKIEILH